MIQKSGIGAGAFLDIQDSSYGHDETTWKNIISQLKTIGYDGTISIEHEDALMSVKRRGRKSNRISEKDIIREQNSGTWWT